MEPTFANRWEQIRETAERIRFIEQLPGALQLARYSALSIEDLLSRLRGIEVDPEPPKVIDFLTKLDWSEEHQRQIATIIEGFLERIPNVTPSQRGILDRAVYRLLFRLPLAMTKDLAVACLQSKRTMLRKSAYRAYSTHGVDLSVVGVLREHYDMYGKQDPLVVLARCPDAVIVADPRWLLENLDERYWRMRVLRAVMGIEDPSIHSLVSNYPLEFLWAAGKEQDPGWLALVRLVVQDSGESPEVVRWAIWVYGVLGAVDDLADISTTAEALIYQLPDLRTDLRTATLTRNG